MSLVGFPGFDTLQIVKGNELLTCIATSERMVKQFRCFCSCSPHALQDRFFCSQCGSLVYHAFKVPGQEFNDAPAVLFENFDAVSPKLHVFYANRRRNHHDELPKFTALPDSQMLTNEGEEKK